MSTEVIEMNQPAQRLAVSATPATPADIVIYAMQKGADIAQIEKFMDLQMKWEADQARKAFVAAMSEFKKSPPEVTKDKLVSFKGTSYMHATLGNVTEAIVAGLAAHGFSHRWDTQQEGAQIVVTCILTHKLGHSERTTLSSSKDDSGSKNSIQAMASAITYLQRYTLLAATGVATKDQGDDDGQAAGAPEVKQPARMTINESRFSNAIDKIKLGEYTAEKLRGNFELTTDQETVLADALNDMQKVAQ